MNKKQIIGLFAAALIFVFVGACSMLVEKQSELWIVPMEDTFSMFNGYSLPENDFVAVVDISGTIEDVGSSDFFTTVEYDHQGILDFIDEMISNDDNVGLFLNIDSPGGYTYEIVELYDKLLDYKELTGRPVYAYCNSYCCSGGYYLAATADEIYANQESIIGSIGCIMSSYDCSGLYEKLGIKEVNIASGKNKAMGSLGTPLTDEQRQIYQSIVDESYERFIDAVEKGRGMNRDSVYKIADGRIYTASQALDNGLIDGISGFDYFISYLSDEFYNAEYYTFGQDRRNFFSDFFAKATALIPKSDTQSELELINEYRNGGLMYYADLD